MNIKLLPNQWTTKQVPISIIKHRVVVTDPTYKFMIYGLINARSNIAVRRDSDDNDYYDILNMSVVQESVVSPQQWLDYINITFNLSLTSGTEYQSEALPELFFTTSENRNTFDTIYGILQTNNSVGSEGVNIIIDFGIKLSGGFVRNKFGIDTDNVKNWILSGLNFSTLSLMMEKDSDTDNYVIKESYKTLYGLSKDDIELVENTFKKNSPILPTVSSINNTNIFWHYLDQYLSTISLSARESLFGFRFQGVTISEVNTKNVSFALNQYNRPMYIQTQMKFDPDKQRVYVTTSGPSIPTSIEKGCIVKRDIDINPSKNIQTKINNHIYMVNKK